MIPPVVSPLTADRQADPEGIERLTRHLIDGGADGLFVLGSCGEGPTLTTSTATAVVRGFVAETAGRVPVLVGLGELSTERAMEAAQIAEGEGADAVVVMPPMYYNTEGDGPLLRHVAAVAASTALPIVLYNIPHLTHNPISPEALAELAGIESVIALKESSGDWTVYAPLAAAAAANGLAVFQGAEALTARSLAEGADGAVPGIANLVPGLAARLIAAGRAGSSAAAQALQAELDEVCSLYATGFWLTSLKGALNIAGIVGETLGQALPSLSAEHREMLASRMAQLGLAQTEAVSR